MIGWLAYGFTVGFAAIVYLLFREAQKEVKVWHALYVERGRRAQATTCITLDAVQPDELLREEMDVWIRLSRKGSSATGWPEVEIIGSRAAVRGFVEMNWGPEEVERADEDESWTNLSYPAER